MNELKKTGIFWAVTAVMLLIATVIAWPTSDNTDSQSLSELVGEPLISGFKDPLVVASMKIVNFDEAEGTLSNFEVAKDIETGDWTILSRKGYPADAVEQVTNAANSLIALKVLDVVPCTREDHDDLGVVEPKLEELNVGDEGVGRLVTFRDADKKVVASLIIGDRVKDSETQLNVRIPGQDPVYIVALDDASLTTKFQDWIEEDLLKLSSIDVDQMQVKDYSASLGGGGQISLQKNFTADFAKDGSQWTLAKLQEFDPKRPTAEPTIVDVSDDQKVNATKLNEIQNALDDLKIVNVLRKPEGMSANLKASEDFLSDQDAVASLAGRGFYPVQLTQGGETEILSANGETLVGLKDGVEYVLRFGNIAGLSEEDDSDEEKKDGVKKTTTGVNRYLLVTTRVDEGKFPPPELREVPQSLEDLKKMDEEEAKLNAPESDPSEALQVEPEPGVDDAPAGKEEMKEKAGEETKAEDSAAESVEESEADGDKAEMTEEKSAEKSEEKPGKESDAESTETKPETEDAADSDADQPESKETVDETADADSGETEGEGSESSTTTGQALQEASDDEPKEGEADDANAKESTDDSAKTDQPEATPAEQKTEVDDEAKSDAKEMKAESKDDKKPAEEEMAETEPKSEEKESVEPAETEEEMQERLEATQEQITKENQRKMDERKDQLAKAKNRVRDLNARFADWYYVIPEETYTKLTIKRDDLFEAAGSEAGSAPPSFQSPGGFPGGMPSFGPGN